MGDGSFGKAVPRLAGEQRDTLAMADDQRGQSTWLQPSFRAWVLVLPELVRTLAEALSSVVPENRKPSVDQPNGRR